MADSYVDFKVEWQGIDVMRNIFAMAEQRVIEIITEEMNKFALHIESVTQELAPVDTGDLVDSIKSTKVKYNGVTFEFTIGSNLEYALIVHERPYTNQTRPKYYKGIKEAGYYVNGRGKNTRIKPNVKGKQPGRKFLQNAIEVSEDDWNNTLIRINNRIAEVLS